LTLIVLDVPATIGDVYVVEDRVERTVRVEVDADGDAYPTDPRRRLL
jgi:hypothetical protein